MDRGQIGHSVHSDDRIAAGSCSVKQNPPFWGELSPPLTPPSALCGGMLGTMAEQRIYISSPVVKAYLEELAQLGVYGTRPGAVATFILRKEIMRLIEEGVLKPLKLVLVKGEEEEEADS